VAAKKLEQNTETKPDYNSFGDGSELLVKRLSEYATIPTRGSRNAAGKLKVTVLYFLSSNVMLKD